MPFRNTNYRRRPFRRTQRRYPKRRQWKRRMNIARPRRGVGLPNKLAIKFRYSDNISLDPVAGGFALHVFRATSLFDPDLTGVGHQPNQFDQIMPLYDHYTVVAAKITVTGSGGDALPATMLISLQDDSTTLLAMNQYMESRNRTYITTNETGTGPMKLSKTYNAKRFLGISHPLSEKDLAGTATTNPAENAFFHLVYAGNSGDEFSAAAWKVNLEFFAILTEPITPALS